jgi:hypothetical protein
MYMDILYVQELLLSLPTYMILANCLALCETQVSAPDCGKHGDANTGSDCVG